MAGSVDVLIAADAGDRRLDADAVDGLDALGAHGKRDVPLQGRHPVPLGLQVRGEGSACSVPHRSVMCCMKSETDFGIAVVVIISTSLFEGYTYQGNSIILNRFS